MPSDAFGATVDVNLTGTFHAIQVFGPAMRDAGRGSIVNIGSVYASVAPDPRLYDHLPGDPPFLKPPAYGASKAGVLSLTRYFARLWGPHGVRVNALSPGGVAGGQDEEFVRRYCARVPMRRMAEPHDLQGPLLFLSSDASRYVNGQELRVDGGFTGVTTAEARTALRTVGNFIGGEERPAEGGSTLPKLLARQRRAAVRGRPLGRPRRRGGGGGGERRAAGLGRAAPSPSAAPSCGGSPSCSSATPTSWPR